MSSETAPLLPLPPTLPFAITVYDSQLSHPERTDHSPPYFRDSPLRLIGFDLGVVLRHALQIPNIFLPVSPRSDIGFTGVISQVVFTVVSLGLTGLAVSSLVAGLPTPILAAVVLAVTMMVMSRLQGQVKMDHDMEDKYADEAWLFVNGIATSASGLQLILTRLNVLFGRRVTGIHNKTFGIWWDLVECLLQRDFMWATADVRVGYETICQHIRNPAKKKVVLMAHSQGGIIMSAWVDQLLSDFPADALRKIEIYTFASAANHFSVPSSPVYPGAEADAITADAEAASAGTGTATATAHTESTGTGSRQIGRRFVFGVVEHFVNTKDYVSLIGLIEFAPHPPATTVPGVLPAQAAEGRFAGRIFRREGHTGHLLVAHYLKEGDCILDYPAVRQYSQLTKYLGGRRAEVEDRYWKATVVTQPTATPPAV
ncbi:uncharacterized protein MKK02DRAFT_40230 [Dioszegia hungarica]|uniref:DUF676 domain-containing protein n=1 Tax=Dioszegia hungarica TaxID=4972 RepID=A0AA38LXR5_9TREE|nr:uncharacterized protein MKK02DRAFT_40230 [Dioszegia hungarica]KAI9639900.1 hypothetical protein MKK02DRAFT_40230 [Dioszegia hungarica]